MGSKQKGVGQILISLGETDLSESVKSESGPKAGSSSPCNEKQVSSELGNVR